MIRFSFYSKADNTKLLGYETGNKDGLPIIFIHGFAQSYWCWGKQLSNPDLSNHRIITFDLRGHGRSDKPITKCSYLNSKIWAADISSLIEELKLVKPVIVAWSYSGLIVCDYLRHNGDNNIAGINFVGARPKTGTPDFYTMLGYNLSVPIKVCEALLERSVDNDTIISKIEIPTHITHGDRDTSVLVSMAHHNHAQIPNSSLSIFNGVGHAPFYEDPVRFNRELITFVDHCHHS
jgi:non-heme chloroperoxidase